MKAQMCADAQHTQTIGHGYNVHGESKNVVRYSLAASVVVSAVVGAPSYPATTDASAG